MKRIAIAIALWAALGVALFASGAFAADLGGTCCSDLESRVAELEATVARKGNTKVTLEVTGQVSKSILWVDGQDAIIGDNAMSPSRFAFTGRARAMDGLIVGYTMEVGVDDDLYIRHSFAFIEGKFGKVSIGQTSQATDAITDLDTSNSTIASTPSIIFLGLIDGDRRNVVKYETGNVFGFTASASWSSDDTWDAALRYAAEHGGFRIAAGIGYAEYVFGNRFSGSASVMHMTSGLFANAFYADGDYAFIGDGRAYGGKVGVERNWLGIGASTLFTEFGKLDAGIDGDGWGVGGVQAFNWAATDVFLTYRNIEDVDVVQSGIRVRF